MSVHSSEKIVKNTAVFTLAMIGQKVISFFYFWYLSSRFGPEKMGAWVWALSFSSLFGVFSDLGLASILAREAARHEERAGRFLNATLFIKIPLLIFTIILGSIILYFSNRFFDFIFCPNPRVTEPFKGFIRDYIVRQGALILL